MSFNQISLTLYDFLGYILPGYVLMFSLSLLEARFLNSNVFSLSRVESNLLLFTLVAYFLGQVAHTLGTLVKVWWRKWFTNESGRLADPILEQIRTSLREVYGLPADTKLNTLDMFLLADSYVLANGGSTEREVLQAREGFFKASMVAFSLLTLVLCASLLLGGARIQGLPGAYVDLYVAPTLVLIALTLGTTALFRDRYMFFSRIKNNNSLLLFLAHHKKPSGRKDN